MPVECNNHFIALVFAILSLLQMSRPDLSLCFTHTKLHGRLLEAGAASGQGTYLILKRHS